MKFNSSKICLLAVSVITGINASAQKLPSVQKDAVYAPVNVKIDGKPTEWLGKFQARNSATLLTYVMANDKENLYLTVQADNSIALGKIFYEGISLVIKSHKDKKLTPLKITYPLVTLLQRSEIVIPLRDKKNNADSVAAVVNAWLGKAAKLINISGFTVITDPDVSVYNDLGLKAVVQVDNTRTMTFEYCLPLKYFKHLLDENASFDYGIVVNGATLQPGHIVVGGASVNNDESNTAENGAPISEIFSPTDLKGTYTLAKK